MFLCRINASEVLSMFTESFRTGGRDSGWCRAAATKACSLAACHGHPAQEVQTWYLGTNLREPDPPAVVEANQSASSSGAAAGGPQPLSFPQGVLDQLVAQVTDEVTRHLSPPEDCGTANRNTLVSNAASELPLVSNLPPAIPVPGAAVATSGLAVTVLQRSVGATQGSLSGEVQIPAQLFASPSLPIDARLSEKLQSKIWANEFFENFSLTNLHNTQQWISNACKIYNL